MKVLVTGAAGSIGRTLVRGLADLGHEIRGLDLVDGPPDACTLGWVTGDCLDPDVAGEAVAGVDAIVHLAGNPDEASLPESLESHVHTTGRLLEAMLTHGVGRMAYASSNHAVGHTPVRGPADDRRETATRHPLRRREGCRRGVAEPLRRPSRHQLRRHADRLLPRATDQHP